MTEVSADTRLDAVRSKYRAEKERRTQGREYVRLADSAIPPAQPGKQRPRYTDHVDVTIVGAGIGGLTLGSKLRQSGLFQKIRLVDEGSDVGGTWQHNDFPGLHCDIESYIYLPLLEESDTFPGQKYVSGDLIQRHCRALAAKFGLYEDALLSTSVKRIEWSESTHSWTIETDCGDVFTTRFVCAAIGSLSIPKVPHTPGLENFRGHAFHANRWDYEYTGGNIRGELSKLRDKTVALIGTGATATQCVPHLANDSKRLLVFQRTPAVVLPRDNGETSAKWYEALPVGWQAERRENFHRITSGLPVEMDLVGDSWTAITGRLAASLLRGGTGEVMSEDPELVDLRLMDDVRAKIESAVTDPTTAESLKPYYRLFCKRPCFHDGYYETFNRENVTLVDTGGRGISAMGELGPIVDGREYQADCVIFATGFESEYSVPYSERAGFQISGTGGVQLEDWWADGVRTLHGVMTRNFPNLFFVSKAQSGLHVNVSLMVEEVGTHIAHILTGAINRGATRIEPTACAEDAWVEEILALANRNFAFADDCTPGLFNNEGEPRNLPLQNSSYGKGSIAFLDRINDWRRSTDLAGLEFGSLAAVR